MNKTRLYRWSDDTRGTTPRPEVGALAVLRCARRASVAQPLPWSLCRCETTRTGATLANVSDHRTMREAAAALEAIRGEKKPVRRGLRFRHARLLAADYSTPLGCVVTAVRQGNVYYRPVEGGSPGTFSLADWDRWTLPFSGQIQGT